MTLATIEGVPDKSLMHWRMPQLLRWPLATVQKEEGKQDTSDLPPPPEDACQH